MLIGELARRAGTSTRALRYYETKGLLDSGRTGSGYRTYDDDDLRVVEEIRSRLAAGFGLEEIRPFVACLRAGHDSAAVCPDSVLALRRKLDEVQADLDQLTALKDELTAQLDRAIAMRETVCRQRR